MAEPSRDGAGFRLERRSVSAAFGRLAATSETTIALAPIRVSRNSGAFHLPLLPSTKKQ